MFRYVKASFDTSIPEWLKSKIDSRFWRYSSIPVKLRDKYGVALDKAVFEPGVGRGNSVNIYKLNNDQLYIPGINDDEEVRINGRYRRLGKLGKATLADSIQEVVHIDLNNPDNLVEKREPYRDPRRSYYHDKQGYYAGQFYNDYRNEWSEKGRTPSNEVRARDKSGYKVPDPADMLTRYYENFPNQVTQKVDALYDRILDVKEKVLDPDIINTPHDRDEQMDVGNAIYRLRDAITEYRELLNLLDKESGTLKGVDSDTPWWARGDSFKSFSNKVRSISSQLDEAERLLTTRW